jgi:hypothetical protein
MELFPFITKGKVFCTWFVQSIKLFVQTEGELQSNHTPQGKHSKVKLLKDLLFANRD